jgi:hypothetical protein
MSSVASVEFGLSTFERPPDFNALRVQSMRWDGGEFNHQEQRPLVQTYTTELPDLAAAGIIAFLHHHYGQNRPPYADWDAPNCFGVALAAKQWLAPEIFDPQVNGIYLGLVVEREEVEWVPPQEVAHLTAGEMYVLTKDSIAGSATPPHAIVGFSETDRHFSVGNLYGDPYIGSTTGAQKQYRTPWLYHVVSRPAIVGAPGWEERISQLHFGGSEAIIKRARQHVAERERDFRAAHDLE